MKTILNDATLETIPRSLIDAARGPQCNILAVYSLAEGRKLPKEHHANFCIACQYDAMLLRERFAIMQPTIPLSLLLMTRREQLESPEGIFVEFSDCSTAQMRLVRQDSNSNQNSQSVFRLLINDFQIAGRGLKIVDLCLEVRKEDVDDDGHESRGFSRVSKGHFSIDLAASEIDGGNVRLLVRFRKRKRQLSKGRAGAFASLAAPPIIIPLRFSSELRLVAKAKAKAKKPIVLIGKYNDQNISLEIHELSKGRSTLRLMGMEVIPNLCLVYGDMEIEFASDGYAQVDTESLKGVLDGTTAIELRLRD